jgi:hypothetical protein
MNQREAFEAWWQDNRPSCWHADWFTQTMQDLAWKSWQAALASQWQPIETAPKDGTVILASLPGSDVPHSVRWHNMKRGWCLSWDGWKLGEYSQPTHWQPLPPEPTK